MRRGWGCDTTFVAVCAFAVAVLMLSACLIGLEYGWVAWRTGSIRWTTLAHIGTDAMGIGATLVVLGR